MAVVTKATFESLSDKIGSAYAAQKSAAPYIVSGLAEVVGLDDSDQEYDLLFAFYNANANSGVTFQNKSNFTSLATALSTHSELRSGKTLTQFLTDEGIGVSADYAEVSKAAGWDVDAFII